MKTYKDKQGNKIFKDNWDYANRSYFDLNYCSISKGFAKIDTNQDAWYYGAWVNPFYLKIVEYSEGDITITECKNKENFKNIIKNWYGLKGIDTGLDNINIENEFKHIGLSNLLH